jgi:hypothetical protein
VHVHYLAACLVVRAATEPALASGVVSAKEKSRRLEDGKRTSALVTWRADPGDHIAVAVFRPLSAQILAGTKGSASRGAFFAFRRRPD